MADKQKKWNRTYVSLSFSVPPDLEAPMNQRAADAGFRSRSEYICKLVEDDLRKAGVLKAVPPGKKKLPRIVRGRKSSKNTSASKSTSDMVGLPERHPLSVKMVLSLRELRNERWVLTARATAPAFRQRIDELSAAAGFRPRIVLESDRSQAVLAMVAAENGRA